LHPRYAYCCSPGTIARITIDMDDDSTRTAYTEITVRIPDDLARRLAPGARSSAAYSKR
jgi:hypothetical protein